MSEQNLIPPPVDSPIRVSPIPTPITVEYVSRSMRMIPVSSDELDTVASLSNSINLAFFCLCVGAAIAFGIVLTTTSVPDPKVYASYVALLGASLIGTAFFGTKALSDFRAAKKKLGEMKRGT